MTNIQSKLFATQKRKLRFIILANLFFILICLTFYMVAGLVEVPAESSLADLSYTIPILHDYDGSTTLNNLNGGEGYESVIFWIAVFALLYVLMCYFYVHSQDPFAQYSLMIALIALLKQLGGSIEQIFFYYKHLRSGVQPLIEQNHVLRVILAYIKLHYDNADGLTLAPGVVLAFYFFVIALISAVLAWLICSYICRRRQESES